MNKQIPKVLRPHNQNISEDLYTINKNKDADPVVHKPDTTTTIYTIVDKQDGTDEYGNPILYNKDNEFAQDRKEACAMRVAASHGDKLFVKFGGNNKKLLNLNDAFDHPDPKQIRNGIEMWQYREVGINAFNLYIKFLKTKNPTYIVQAERELI